MVYHTRSIAQVAETQTLPEDEESNRALDLHDEEFTGSGSSVLSIYREKKEAPGPLENHLDLEKGINPAETELVGSKSGQGSRDYEEEGKCRVCHMVFAGESGSNEATQLGCNCKDDLSMAHRECAEAWFKIKGNRICEICGATVQNVFGNDAMGFMDQGNDRGGGSLAEQQTRCWQNLSLCNFFLACIVIAFILLWLFRITIS